MKTKILITLLLLAGLSLAGCQPAPTTHYLGAKANNLDIVNLGADQTGPQHWQDLYVTVDYRLDRKAGTLDIDGMLSFSDSVKANFTRVEDLKLKLFLLDKDLSVVNYLQLARSLSYSPEGETHFSKTVKLDKNVVAFAFGYEGSFSENDPTGSTVRPVWKLPKTDQ